MMVCLKSNAAMRNDVSGDKPLVVASLINGLQEDGQSDLK